MARNKFKYIFIASVIAVFLSFGLSFAANYDHDFAKKMGPMLEELVDSMIKDLYSQHTIMLGVSSIGGTYIDKSPWKFKSEGIYGCLARMAKRDKSGQDDLGYALVNVGVAVVIMEIIEDAMKCPKDSLVYVGYQPEELSYKDEYQVISFHQKLAESAYLQGWKLFYDELIRINKEKGNHGKVGELEKSWIERKTTVENQVFTVQSYCKKYYSSHQKRLIKTAGKS